MRYTIEFGVNYKGERQCAVESGPYLTRKGAYRVAKRLLGKPAFFALLQRNGSRFDTGPETDYLPIAGVTIEGFTENGTQWSVNIDHKGGNA
jgi:hypothetical protein